MANFLNSLLSSLRVPQQGEEGYVDPAKELASRYPSSEQVEAMNTDPVNAVLPQPSLEGNSPRAMPNFANKQTDPVVFTNNLFKNTPAFDPRVQPMEPDQMSMEEMTIEGNPKLDSLKSSMQKLKSLRGPASEAAPMQAKPESKPEEEAKPDDLFMHQGISKILQGLATAGGGKIDDNSEFYNKYRQYMAEKPQRELENKMKKRNYERMTKMDDPNSQESVNMRKALSKLAPDLVALYGKDWDKISANDKDSIFDIIRTREQIEGRKESARLSAQDRAERAAERKEQNDAKLEQKKSEILNKDIQKFQDKSQDTRSILNTVNDFETVLGKNLNDLNVDTRADKIKAGDKSLDLPGVSIPGIGRVSAYDTDARKLRDAASGIFNVELRNRSGAAVTDSELSRLRQEFSDGKFNTESELIDAVKRYKARAQKVLQQQESGFSPDAVKTYKERNDTNEVLTTGNDKKEESSQIPMTTEDSQAIKWAKQNPKDPRAQQILKLHGM